MPDEKLLGDTGLLRTKNLLAGKYLKKNFPYDTNTKIQTAFREIKKDFPNAVFLYPLEDENLDNEKAAIVVPDDKTVAEMLAYFAEKGITTTGSFSPSFEFLPARGATLADTISAMNENESGMTFATKTYSAKTGTSFGTCTNAGNFLPTAVLAAIKSRTDLAPFKAEFVSRDENPYAAALSARPDVRAYANDTVCVVRIAMDYSQTVMNENEADGAYYTTGTTNTYNKLSYRELNAYRYFREKLSALGNISSAIIAEEDIDAAITHTIPNRYESRYRTYYDGEFTAIYKGTFSCELVCPYDMSRDDFTANLKAAGMLDGTVSADLYPQGFIVCRDTEQTKTLKEYIAEIEAKISASYAKNVSLEIPRGLDGNFNAMLVCPPSMSLADFVTLLKSVAGLTNYYGTMTGEYDNFESDGSFLRYVKFFVAGEAIGSNRWHPETDFTDCEGDIFDEEELANPDYTGEAYKMSELFPDTYRTMTEPPTTVFAELKWADGIFEGCGNLTTVQDVDLSAAWSMKRAFKRCLKLENITGLDISSTCVADEMFRDCLQLTEAPPTDFSRVISARYVFAGCLRLPETWPYVLELGALEDGVMSARGMFDETPVKYVQIRGLTNEVRLSSLPAKWQAAITAYNGGKEYDESDAFSVSYTDEAGNTVQENVTAGETKAYLTRLEGEWKTFVNEVMKGLSRTKTEVTQEEYDAAKEATVFSISYPLGYAQYVQADVASSNPNYGKKYEYAKVERFFAEKNAAAGESDIEYTKRLTGFPKIPNGNTTTDDYANPIYEYTKITSARTMEIDFV